MNENKRVFTEVVKIRQFILTTFLIAVLHFVCDLHALSCDAPQTVDSNGMKVGLWTSIAINASGSPCIIYLADDNVLEESELRYAEWSGKLRTFLEKWK